MSYDGSAARRSTVVVRDNPLSRQASPNDLGASPAQRGTDSSSDKTWPKLPDGRPDFTVMTSAQRRAYDSWRLQRIYG
jgi:hypothetical protein